MTPADQSRRAVLLLALGAATGIVLAAAGLVATERGVGSSLPTGAVARVNGDLINMEDYQRLLGGLADDQREAITDEQRRRVLDRLIDEELLIQRGLELGFARQDRRLRADLTSAVVSSIVAEAEDLQPTPAQLQAFYEERHDFFTQPGAVRVRQIFCRVPDTTRAPDVLTRAQVAAARLRAGEDFAAIRRDLGDPELSPLPDDLLPPSKLRDYLGPTASRIALSLATGEVSDPIRSGTGFHVLEVLERQSDRTPPLADIEAQVVAEYRRQAGDQALRDYLADLRARADIAVAAPLP